MVKKLQDRSCSKIKVGRQKVVRYSPFVWCFQPLSIQSGNNVDDQIRKFPHAPLSKLLSSVAAFITAAKLPSFIYPHISSRRLGVAPHISFSSTGSGNSQRPPFPRASRLLTHNGTSVLVRHLLARSPFGVAPPMQVPQRMAVTFVLYSSHYPDAA